MYIVREVSKATYVVLVCRMEHYNRYTFSSAEDAINRYITESQQNYYVEVGQFSAKGYEVIDRTW